METSGESLSSNKLSRESEDSEFDIWRAYIIAKQDQKEVKTFKSNHLHSIVLEVTDFESSIFRWKNNKNMDTETAKHLS